MKYDPIPMKVISREIHFQSASFDCARKICQFMHSIFRFFDDMYSFSFNRLSSKLVGMFVGIVPMFVLKDFVPGCFIAQICANSGAHAHFCAYLRDEAIPNKIL